MVHSNIANKYGCLIGNARVYGILANTNRFTSWAVELFLYKVFQ